MKTKSFVLSALLAVAMFGAVNMASAAFSTGFAYFDPEGTFEQWDAAYDTNIIVGAYEYGYTYAECFNTYGETIYDGSWQIYWESLSLGDGGDSDYWTGTSGLKLEEYWYVGYYQFAHVDLGCVYALQGYAVAEID